MTDTTISPPRACDSVADYARSGFTAFSVDIQWDPTAKKGSGGKRSCHPRSWQTAGGKKRAEWNSVAINTGLSGLVVIDIDDDRSLADFVREAESRGVDLNTRRARSGSGRGGHFYFRSPSGAPPIKSTDNVRLWGIARPDTGKSSIDVKAAGGLIYAPPSSYAMPNGTARRYAWLDESVPIMYLPDALGDALEKQGDAPPPNRRVAQPRPEDTATQPGNPKPLDQDTPERRSQSGAADPLSLLECAKLVSALSPNRAASEGRRGDWLTVGFALKHNEALLKRCGREAEASGMPALFDNFSALAPDRYPGAAKILEDFRGFRPDGGVTVASLISMAKEDSFKSTPDPVKSLVAQRVGCSPADVDIRKLDGRLSVSTPRGAGHVDPRDLALFLPSSKAMLAAPSDSDGAIPLPKAFSTKAKKHFKDLKRGQVLEYHRESEDLAKVKPRGLLFPLIKLMDPHTPGSLVKYTHEEGAESTQLRDVSDLNCALAEALAESCRASLGESTYGAIVNYGTVNQIVINGAGDSQEDSRAKKTLALEDRILADAKDKRLMKRNGMVYEPLPDKPCAYRPLLEYKPYISRLFGSDRALRGTMRNVRDLCDFLSDLTDLEEFPEFNPDNDLISFDNGVLDIVRNAFTPYSEILEGHALYRKTARHHVDKPWTGREETPALDSILDYQEFEEDTKRFVLGLMGRMLFRVKQLDSWEVFLFFFGVAGTGKSLCLNVLSNLYDDAAIGAFAAKQDGNFALEGFLGKDVIISKETERDIIASVNESDLKKMASGEDPTVNRKNKTPLRVPRWQAPMAFGSNHLPKFSKESSDSLGRRLVPVRHSNVVKHRDGSLEGRLLSEMPNICCRIVNAYHFLRDEFGDADITQHLPAQMREWGGDVRAAASRLYEFLQMDDHDRQVVVAGQMQTVAIRREEGAVFSRPEFARIYEAWAGEKFSNEESTFAAFGYNSPSGKIHICKSCGKRASVTCCPEQARDNRRKLFVIEHMSLTFETPGTQNGTGVSLGVP